MHEHLKMYAGKHWSTIQIWWSMLRMCKMKFKRSWTMNLNNAVTCKGLCSMQGADVGYLAFQKWLVLYAELSFGKESYGHCFCFFTRGEGWVRRLDLEKLSKINRGISWCVRKKAEAEMKMKTDNTWTRVEELSYIMLTLNILHICSVGTGGWIQLQLKTKHVNIQH